MVSAEIKLIPKNNSQKIYEFGRNASQKTFCENLFFVAKTNYSRPAKNMFDVTRTTCKIVGDCNIPFTIMVKSVKDLHGNRT